MSYQIMRQVAMVTHANSLYGGLHARYFPGNTNFNHCNYYSIGGQWNGNSIDPPVRELI